MNKFLKTIRESCIITKRNFIKTFKTPEQFIDTLLFPIMFLLIFTYIFGGAIAGSVENYLPIIIPGILVFGVMNNAGATGVSLKEDIETGVFNRFRSMPISRIAPLAGRLMNDSIRFIITILITFIIGLIMGFWPAAGFVGVAFVFLLLVFYGWCISWIFAFIGVSMRASNAVQGISGMIVMLLVFLSNAMVPADTLPKVLQVIANLNPVTHMVNAVGDLLGGNILSPEVLISLLAAIGMVVVFAPLTLKVYMKKV